MPRRRRYRPNFDTLEPALNPARCWHLGWKDRLAWRVFSLIAHNDVACVAWQYYRDGRRAETVTWDFGTGGRIDCHKVQRR